MDPDIKRHNKYENRKKERKYDIVEARHNETTKFPPRTEDQKQKVSDLVYEYLAQVANVYNRRKQRNNARSNFQRVHLRKDQARNIYPKRNNKKDPRPKSILDYNLTHNVPSYLPFTYEETKSQLSRKPILKNIVNDYAKAVNEGRNISRKYVCKALSFGVHSGFLVPTDDKGQMLRVSSNLCLFQTGQNMKNNKVSKKLKSYPAHVKQIKRKRLEKRKNGKRFREVKKKTKERETKKL